MAVEIIDSSEPTTIHIDVSWQFSDVAIRFKTYKHRKLKTLMDVYCERIGVPIRRVRFLFDGQLINHNDTPLSLEMEDGDVIEVLENY